MYLVCSCNVSISYPLVIIKLPPKEEKCIYMCVKIHTYLVFFDEKEKKRLNMSVRIHTNLLFFEYLDKDKSITSQNVGGTLKRCCHRNNIKKNLNRSDRNLPHKLGDKCMYLVCSCNVSINYPLVIIKLPQKEEKTYLYVCSNSYVFALFFVK